MPNLEQGPIEESSVTTQDIFVRQPLVDKLMPAESAIAQAEHQKRVGKFILHYGGML